jgi:hypothetical protein
VRNVVCKPFVAVSIASTMSTTTSKCAVSRFHWGWEARLSQAAYEKPIIIQDTYFPFVEDSFLNVALEDCG